VQKWCDFGRGSSGKGAKKHGDSHKNGHDCSIVCARVRTARKIGDGGTVLCAKIRQRDGRPRDNSRRHMWIRWQYEIGRDNSGNGAKSPRDSRRIGREGSTGRTRVRTPHKNRGGGTGLCGRIRRQDERPRDNAWRYMWMRRQYEIGRGSSENGAKNHGGGRKNCRDYSRVCARVRTARKIGDGGTKCFAEVRGMGELHRDNS
jgi:hypothetical protein